MNEKGKVVEIIDADLEPLIPKFMTNTRRELGEMKDALAAGDFSTVQRLGHNAKGAGFGYGFTQMGELGKGIEQAARDQDPDGCGKLLQDFAAYLEFLEIQYE
ncbi:Hpt domain-containing protein [Salidesulfovibrio onnuriiensis]|uniref:Hpt domain-containing protein n=1 Tax=Salidesulfovibrio onnuriiensis TaxID=2583823 RepID=UPI0011CB43B3|nr:Hpt domain-containing protein [Salidesulfovibrio onnuriiensis]